MEFKFTQGENNTYIMEVEIPYEELELSIKKVVKEYAQRVNIPGFRKGKVPAQVVESYVGVQTIITDAAENAIAEKYLDEINQQEFEPISSPKLETVQAEKNKPVIIKGTIPVKPPVKLGKYKGIEVTKRVYKVGELDIEQEIENNLSRIATMIDAPYDTVSEMGHVLYLDFAGEIDGEFFEGGSAEDYPLQLGAGQFIPGFEEQLVGLRVGDSKDVNVTFPHGYAEEKLAGKDALFHCRVNKIRIRELPELNDDLVKDLSESADTVAEYKAELAAKLQEEADQHTEEELKNTILELAAMDVEVEIPMMMTEPRVNRMYEDLSQRLEEQELDIQDYLKYMKTDLFSLRKEFRKQAEADAKVEMMLAAIAKREKITYTDEEVDKEVAELADYYMTDVETYRKQLEANDQMYYLYDKIILEKAANFIFDNAVITEEYYDAEMVKKMMEEQAAAAAENKPQIVEDKPAKKKTAKKAAEKAEGEEAPKKTRKTTKKAAEEAPVEEGEEKPKKRTTKKTAEKAEGEEAPKKTRKTTKKTEEN